MNQEIEQVMAKYLSGEASSEDILLLDSWLNAEGANKETFLKIKKYWYAEISLTGYNKTDTIDHLLKRIRKARKRKKHTVTWLVCLNIVTAAMLAGVVYYFTYFQVASEPVYYSYMSGNGVSEFSLEDGTVVFLNKNSTLSYSDIDGAGMRKISLNGEAYFQVPQNQGQDFVIDLNGSEIQVLEAAFNVRNKENEKIIKTTLVKGTASFGNSDKRLLLQPEQQLSYDRSNNSIEVKTVDLEMITAWKDNLIKYKSLSFEELVLMVSDYYDVEIVITDKRLRNQRLTGTLDAKLPVENILDVLKSNLSYKWVKKNDQYVIM